ncbi:unnamed protein product [Zymoseptoria tritici ST99CH_1E4]|uniref:Uncharacterized protein n=1 Tax=Zymoseptoria tritici ST99CH_1E4 TaxID=1276532 RepID=A0A2H1H953_ZYMTR|nr:unnamed protein product [Zymoseptoria tritici ST99CH_1E4]
MAHRSDHLRTAELHLKWTDDQFRAAKLEVQNLKAELSLLTEHIEAPPSKDNDHSSAGRSTKKGKDEMSDIIWRLDNLEKVMKMETEVRHEQLQAACVRWRRNDVHQRLFRETQAHAFGNIASAVRAFIQPLEQALSESAQVSIRAGDLEEAQRNQDQLDTLVRLADVLAGCLRFDQ